MAFQRPFLIILKREEPGQPWGFRVSGGADLATPPRVDKVVDGGLAALQGMHEGDLIIQVGKHNVQDLTEARINALLAQPAKRLEVFIVREDFLQKPRKGEPSTVKAVVHNQYNSPLQLYSQEKVAETLAYHAQAITAEDGVNNIQPVGLPQNLVRSAVLQALSEDEIGGNPYRTANGTTAVQRVTAPPTPPPKPRPPSYSGGPPQPERPHSSSGHHVTFSNPGAPGTPPVQQHQTYIPPPPPLHSYQQASYQQPAYQEPAYQQPSYQQQQPATYPAQHARQSSYEDLDPRQQRIREAELRQRQYEEERLQQAQYEEGRFRQPPQDFRRVEFDAEQRRLREAEERRRRVLQEEESRKRQEEVQRQRRLEQEEQERQRRQEQQEYEQYQQHQQQYQRYLEEQKSRDDELRRRTAEQQQQQQQEAARRRQFEEQQRRAQLQQQQQKQQQQQLYQQQQQQQVRFQNAQREPLNVQQAQQEAQRRFQPSTAVASSPQYQEQVGSQTQRWENKIWEEQQSRMPGTPLGSPTVSRRARDGVWPPKESSVRWTPKTGFSPQLARQSSQGAKQFVWPPPKTGVANGDEGGFPSRPPSRSAVNAWHPPQSPTSGTRTPPFARSPSLGRRTRDIAWPPPQAESSPKFVPRPVSRTGLHRPDEYIHQNASCGVPATYRPPPNSSQYL